MRLAILGLAFAGLVLEGCDSESAPLDPRFGRTWVGGLGVCADGAYCNPFGSVSQVLVLSVADNRLTVTSVCPDASGTIATPQGIGEDAAWSGDLYCPAFFTGLFNLTLHYRRQEFHLQDGGTTLFVLGSGEMSAQVVPLPGVDAGPYPWQTFTFTSQFTGYGLEP
jgi:hypothetical protein